MDVLTNSKQFEFLMAIRNVGMQIVFKRADGKMVLNEFAYFDEYIEDNDMKIKYIKSLELVHDKINIGVLSPDELLLELGQYTPYIVYDDEKDIEQTSLYEDDSWLYD